MREESGVEEKKVESRRRKVQRKEKYMEKQSVKVYEDLQKEEKYPRTGFWYL